MWYFFLSFGVAVALAPAVILIYRRRGWVDDPDKKPHAKTTHTQPVPRGGGLVVFIAIAVIALLCFPTDALLSAILFGAAVLCFMGWLDDVFDIHPLWRLLIGGAVALVVVWSGARIPYISHPFQDGVIRLDQWTLQPSWIGLPASWSGIWIVADVLAVLYIVWHMNIVNWSKGVDGQMPGFVAIALIVIGVLSARFVDAPTLFPVREMCFVAAGAFVGFLVWNMYPQRLMAGYGAGSLAGYFLAVLSILSGAKIATSLMVLAIPTADAVFTIARRLRAGKSPFWGDRGHLHHKLLDVLGWDKRRVALFYWLSTAVMGLLAAYLNTFGKLFTTFAVGCGVVGFLVWAKMSTTQQTVRAPRNTKQQHARKRHGS
jgi:UDP-GlcNAc:undecaprenyl-phosphate GlcNAc-1-phosphate transferase